MGPTVAFGVDPHKVLRWLPPPLSSNPPNDRGIGLDLWWRGLVLRWDMESLSALF